MSPQRTLIGSTCRAFGRSLIPCFSSRSKLRYSVAVSEPLRASLKGPAPRPSALEEWLASRLFFVMSPHMVWMEQPEPPSGLEPFEPVTIERTKGPGVLTATWYPAAGETRGVVLLLHPWLAWGKSY